ncbi:sensor histidine kinase [Actinophytocola sp.]|uniref:sensor histidine kinase n=1 Tax=Actinophytocola sp. TaxID=1872138 RepID=UPI002ED864A0
MSEALADSDPVFTPAARHEAMVSFEHRLRALHSPLVDDAEAAEQLKRQAGSVLDDVAVTVTGAVRSVRPAALLAAEIGASRATHRVHPVESLRAAVVMFDVLLPFVHAALRARRVNEHAVRAGMVGLHESIARRLSLGAMSYAGFLLAKVNNANRDERRRIARELHDQAAHAVGVALQDLELHDVYVDRDPARARWRLDSARVALREALEVVRNLARELRESPVEFGGLASALSGYLAWRVPAGIRVAVSVDDDLDLPAAVSEELYFVLREAIRNTVLHADARNLTVTVAVDGPEVHAVVRDDGLGFDVAETIGSQPGIGLSSIRERLELLGGTLDITSGAGAGTTVSMRLARHRFLT